MAVGVESLMRSPRLRACVVRGVLAAPTSPQPSVSGQAVPVGFSVSPLSPGAGKTTGMDERRPCLCGGGRLFAVLSVGRAGDGDFKPSAAAQHVSRCAFAR
jgi:hypothetical protein